jgi:hypothetical protein
MTTKTCPDYDNDEAMAALGRVCVDTFLHVQFQGRQESMREQIAGLLFNHVSGSCEDEDEDDAEAEAEPEDDDEPEVDDEHEHRKRIVQETSRICGGLTSSEVADIMNGD